MTAPSKLWGIHLDVLSARAIPEAFALAHGLHSIDVGKLKDEREKYKMAPPVPHLPLHRGVTGIFIPYQACLDDIPRARIRSDQTEVTLPGPCDGAEDHGARTFTVPRYVCQAKPVTVAPYIIEEVRAVSGDTTVPLFIVEAPLKALSLTANGFPAIGLGGVFAGSTDTEVLGTLGEVLLSKEMQRIKWTGRTAYVAFDAGMQDSPMVAMGAARLALGLQREGADVRLIAIPYFHAQDSDPFSPNGTVWRKEDQGPDDFIARDGPENFRKLVGESVVADPIKRISHVLENTAKSERTGAVVRLLGELAVQAMLYEGGAIVVDQVAVLSKAVGVTKRSVQHVAQTFAERMSRHARAKQDAEDAKKGLSRVEDGEDVHRVLEDLDRALVGDPRLFQRSGQLVIARGVLAEDATRLKIKFAPESIILSGLGSPGLLPRITEYVDYGFTSSEGVWKRTIPSGQMLSSFLCKPYWAHIRRIRGVAVTPVIHLDGSVVSEGYDPKSEYLVASNVTLPEIFDTPAKDHATAALASLLEPFEEFNFGTEAERYTPVALALTLLLRPVIRGNVPAWVQTAPQKNCGKSLATKGACVLATGQIPASNTWAGLEEEQEKMLGGAADAGANLLFFDNVKDEMVVGGAPLERVLTCDGQTSFRILGESKMPTRPWGAVLTFTGNRVKVGGAFDRRAVMSTMLRPDTAKESFRHPDLLEYIKEERSKLLAAAFTLIRAWVQAGSPTMGLKRLDSFEHWGQTVAAMIVWAGGGDVRSLVRDEVGSEEDGHELALLAGMHAWLDAEGKRETTVKDLVGGLFPRPMDGDEYDELRTALETIAGFRGKGDDRKLDVRRLGNRLKGMKDVLQGGYRLRLTGKAKAGYTTWTVARTGGPHHESSTYRQPECKQGESGESGESNSTGLRARGENGEGGREIPISKTRIDLAGAGTDSPDSPDSPKPSDPRTGIHSATPLAETTVPTTPPVTADPNNDNADPRPADDLTDEERDALLDAV